MLAERKFQGRCTSASVKVGLEVLYAKPSPEDRMGDVAPRNLDAELRERYWIRQGQDVGVQRGRSWTHIGFGMRWPIEREELGRTRDEPGDGFRYVFRGDAATDGRAEWFEVTEVFEGVNAKDIKAFMRAENGLGAGTGFDRDKFLSELDLAIPSRAAQRRAADSVIDKVGRKLELPSYRDLRKPHGYGTLIVGLPLWFATAPLNPLRVENVIDDFETRVQAGLETYTRQLRKRSCPFWRIVVVWNGSIKSLQEWYGKARLDVYDDPARRRLGDLPVRAERFVPVVLKVVSMIEERRRNAGRSGVLTRHVSVAMRDKKGSDSSLQLPTALAAWRQVLEESGAWRRDSLRERIRRRARSRILHALCFLRAYGWRGFEKWLAARVSPQRRIAAWAMKRRALRLYRASRRSPL